MSAQVLLSKFHRFLETQTATLAETNSRPTKRASKVQFVPDEPNESVQQSLNVRRLAPRLRVKERCEHLRKALTSKLDRLNLELEDGELYKTQSSRTRFTSNEFTNVISLGQLVSSGTVSLGEKVKRVIAVLISYAVLHHHGDSWLGPSWSRNDVYFMKSAAAISIRPYIFTRVRKLQTEAVTPDHKPDLDDVDPDEIPIHPHPDLISLGTILLELHSGKAIEVLAADLGIDEMENINARWSVAYEVYEKLKRDLPDNYSGAINASLDTNFGIGANRLEEEECKEEDFRRLIYNEVVRPLEDELDQGFGKSVSVEDLDSFAETMDFSGWGQTVQRSMPEQFGPRLLPSLPHGSEASKSSTRQRHVDKKQRLCPPQLAQDSNVELFDDASAPENISSKSHVFSSPSFVKFLNTMQLPSVDGLDEEAS